MLIYDSIRFITTLDLPADDYKVSRHERARVSAPLVSLVVRSMGFWFPMTHFYLIT